MLRLNDEEIPVNREISFAKPAAQNIAHTFYNSGTENLRLILDVGTIEKEDTCYYPDEDIYMQSNGERRIFRGSALDSSWSSNRTKVFDRSCSQRIFVYFTIASYFFYAFPDIFAQVLPVKWNSKA